MVAVRVFQAELFYSILPVKKNEFLYIRHRRGRVIVFPPYVTKNFRCEKIKSALLFWLEPRLSLSVCFRFFLAFHDVTEAFLSIHKRLEYT